MSISFTSFNDRRKELGMTYAVLAQRSGVSEPTVKRIVGRRGESASFANVVAVATALGLSIRFEEQSAERVRRDQANRKAGRLVGMVQATSALESQALEESVRRRLVKASANRLLSGSNRRLWSE